MSDKLEEFQKYNYHAPRNCENCNGVMHYKGIGEYSCEYCGHIMYDDYGLVRNYLEVNPGATSALVARETGVSEKTIKNMLKEERLQIREDSRSFMKCEGCGASITSGRYCEACAKIAMAVAKRKKDKQILEEKKEHVQVISTEIPRGEQGRKRFLGNDD